MNLTRRDEELLQTLAIHAKAVTPAQWWGAAWPEGRSGLRACNRRVRALEEAGLVEVCRGWAGIAPTPDAPLAVWTPGVPPPDLAAVHAKSAERWKFVLSRLRSVRYMRATARGAARAGGVTSPVRPSELSHDLLLTAAYFATRRKYPNVALRWESERAVGLSGRSAHGFDAIIRLPGRPVAIEVVGDSYTIRDLLDLHALAERLGWKYQAW